MKIDLLFINGSVFNVYLKQFLPHCLAVKEGRILYNGPYEKDLFEAEKVIDAAGKYIVPGLIDSHMHIQSSMMVPGTFSDAVLPHGVTTVISEPHEIANVFGLSGIEASLAAASRCALDIFLAMPSSVPSTSAALETTGGEIGIPEIREMMKNPRTICLGEVMNVHDVVYKPDCKVNQIIRYVRAHAPLMPLEGHCPRVTGLPLAVFLARGVTSDHTEQTMEGMRQRITNGMFIQLQKKSLHEELLSYIDTHHLEDRMALVTDDTMPDALLAEGHLDQIVRLAIRLGFPAEKAIYCASYSPAQRMRLFDRGALDPGKLADLILLDDLPSFHIAQVYKKGQPAASSGHPASSFPAAFYDSVHVPFQKVSDFEIPAPFTEGTITCRAALVQEHSTMTLPAKADLPVRDGKVLWENSSYALAAVIERHGKGGGRGFLLIGGNALTSGAAASTYAHDHHNLLVLGRNKKDMAAAANEVIRMKGGLCAVQSGNILGAIHLPVAGILSEAPLETLGKEAASFKKALTALGYRQDNPIMSMTTLGLPVSPALKVTDKGIIDVQKQEIVSFFIKQ